MAQTQNRKLSSLFEIELIGVVLLAAGGIIGYLLGNALIGFFAGLVLLVSLIGLLANMKIHDE